MKKRLQRVVLTSFLALISGQGIAADSESSTLLFEDAWVRAMPPGMKMTAAFGRIINTSERDFRLTGFSSPQFGDVSLHRTEQVDGVSRMREIGELTVAAGDEVELLPGGYHLMLMMPSGELAADQTVTIQMTTKSGRAFDYELPFSRR